MDRIGIAASKMAKGNIVLYNGYVVLLTFLFAFFVFVVAGAAIMLALVIVGYIINGLLPQDLLKDWNSIVAVCMVSLTVVVGFFAAVALIRNFSLDFSSKKIHPKD